MPRRKRPEHIRKQFYDVQDRRCPVCENEIEYGMALYEDKPSGLILDRRCWLFVRHMRQREGLILDNAIRLVRDGYINGGVCSG